MNLEAWNIFSYLSLTQQQGFSTSSLLALWAMSDQVFITIMVGEAESPRYAMSRAAKTVPVRVALLYLLTITFSSLLINPDDPRLFGGSGITQSPFTIALKDAGIPGLDQFLNVVILISCFGFGAESIYVASRILRALSHQRLIPDFIARVDSRGRPIWSLIITGSISIALTYLNFSCE
jgi:yeast amino acid transporter